MDEKSYNRLLDLRSEMVEILNEETDKYDCAEIVDVIIHSLLSNLKISTSDEVKILIKVLSKYNIPWE